jgi:hypothetical protein
MVPLGGSTGPDGPAPNSDILFYIREPHVPDKKMRELVS